jgi:hypothetical protein
MYIEPARLRASRLRRDRHKESNASNNHVSAGADIRGLRERRAGQVVSLEWGADDQRGAANRITPAKVLEAKNLIVRGQPYQLGRVYEAGMPLFGTRHYSLRIPKVFGPNGTNRCITTTKSSAASSDRSARSSTASGTRASAICFTTATRAVSSQRPRG